MRAAALAAATWMSLAHAAAQALPTSIAAEAAGLVRVLADPARGEAAAARLAALRDRASGLSVEVAARTRLAFAVDRARAELPLPVPGYRAWFEQHVAGLLVDFGAVTAARAGLASFAADVEVQRAGQPLGFATERNLLFLAELELEAGLDTTAAERARGVASRLAAATERRFAVVRAEAQALLARASVRLGRLGPAAAELDALERIATDDEEQRRKLLLYRCELLLAQGRPTQVLERLAAAAEGGALPSELLVAQAAALGVLAARGPVDAERYEEIAAMARRPALPAAAQARVALALAHAAIGLGDGDGAARALAMVRTAMPTAESGAGDLLFAMDLESLATRSVREATPLDPEAMAAQAGRMQALFDRMLAQWGTLPLTDDGIGFLLLRERRAFLGEWIECQLALGGREHGPARAFAQVLALQTLGSAARRLQAPPVALAKVRERLLADGDGVLAFVLARAGGHVFGVDRTGVHHWRVAGWDAQQPVLAELRRQLAGALTPSDAERLRPLLREATQSVLPAEVRAFAARQRILHVVDHGLLQGLPLEVLAHDEEHLVGEIVPCTTVDSLPVALRLRDRHADRQPVPGALLVGTLARDAVPVAPVPTGFVAALRGPHRDLRTLLDSEVTASALGGLPWGRAVVQIVAHGVDDPVHAARRLALGAAGEVGPADAAGLPTRGLVIVSSCGAARAPRRVGDETFHGSLGGAFLLGGAHTVVQSAADMMLTAHLALLQEAHVRLGAGDPPAVAFCRARRARAAVDDFAARLEHAQMRVFGLGTLPISRP